MNFYATQHHRHPEVADWILAQYQSCEAAIADWRRGWWAFWSNGRRLEAVGRHLGELSGAVVLWSNGTLPDTAFADPGRSPLSVARTHGSSSDS